MKIKMLTSVAGDRLNLLFGDIIDAERLAVLNDKGDVVTDGETIAKAWIASGQAAEAKPEEEALGDIAALKERLIDAEAARDGHAKALDDAREKIAAALGAKKTAEAEREAIRKSAEEHHNARRKAETALADAKSAADAATATAKAATEALDKEKAAHAELQKAHEALKSEHAAIAAQLAEKKPSEAPKPPKL